MSELWEKMDGQEIFHLKVLLGVDTFIGFMDFSNSKKFCYIKKLAIDIATRNQGYGTQVLQQFYGQNLLFHKLNVLILPSLGVAKSFINEIVLLSGRTIISNLLFVKRTTAFLC